MECIACSNIALKDLNILWSEICMIWFDVILISYRTWTQKLYVTSHLTFSCSESTQNTRSFCTPATFENTKITINMSLNTSTILAMTNSYWHHWKKPSKLPTHLRGHHKDCCQATCQHLDHKSGSTGIKAGEAVKASLEAVLNVAPPSLQLARLPALEAPTCPNLPPTILCSKVVFTSTTRYMVVICFQKRGRIIHLFVFTSSCLPKPISHRSWLSSVRKSSLTNTKIQCLLAVANSYPGSTR